MRYPITQSCPYDDQWWCNICKTINTRAYDSGGHRRPSSLQKSPFDDVPLLNVFEENDDPFEKGFLSDDAFEKKDRIDTAKDLHSDGDLPNQPMLRAMEKLVRKKDKKLRRDREEDLKKKSERSSSSSSKDKDVNPHKQFIIDLRKKDSDDEDSKEFDPKNPMRKIIRFVEHSGFKCNGCKHTNGKSPNIDVQTSALKKDGKGLKTEDLKMNVDKRVKVPKDELKQPRLPDTNKYPLLTQSHIKYSEKKEDPKEPSPKHKKELSSSSSSDTEYKRNREGKRPSPNVSPKSGNKSGSASDSDTSKSKFTEDEKEENKVPQLSKVEPLKLEYKLDINKYMNDINVEPLSISVLSNIGKAAEAKEDIRIAGLTSKLKQLSKVQPSLQPKTKKDASSIVPSLSKVSKGKKEDKKMPLKPKQGETFKPSSSSSDSDAPETPKGNIKNSRIYTNNTPSDPQKSFKRIYKEDEGNETPSNSLSSSRFNLLKSPKNKHAAPNASGAKPNLTKLPPASDESQQIEPKTIEGSKELSKKDTRKSDDITPTPKEETPKDDTFDDETPKSETPKSDAKKSKSDGSSSSDEDKQSSSSKKSSKKSVKSDSQDSRSEKHSDGEGSKSENESEQEDQSSENAVSSHSKKSVKSDDIFGKSLAESIVNKKDLNKEDKKSSDAEDEESEESDDPSETPGK